MTREVSPKLSAAEREAKLSAYRSIIDEYVLRRFPDRVLRYPEATEQNAVGRSILSKRTF